MMMMMMMMMMMRGFVEHVINSPQTCYHSTEQVKFLVVVRGIVLGLVAPAAVISRAQNC